MESTNKDKAIEYENNKQLLKTDEVIKAKTQMYLYKRSNNAYNAGIDKIYDFSATSSSLSYLWIGTRTIIDKFLRSKKELKLSTSYIEEWNKLTENDIRFCDYCITPEDEATDSIHIIDAFIIVRGYKCNSKTCARFKSLELIIKQLPSALVNIIHDYCCGRDWSVVQVLYNRNDEIHNVFHNYGSSLFDVIQKAEQLLNKSKPKSHSDSEFILSFGGIKLFFTVKSITTQREPHPNFNNDWYLAFDGDYTTL